MTPSENCDVSLGTPPTSRVAVAEIQDPFGMPAAERIALMLALFPVSVISRCPISVRPCTLDLEVASAAVLEKY